MPVPKPRRGESEDAFHSRCMSFLSGENTPQDQANAICYRQWRERNKEDAGIFKGLLLKLFRQGGQDGRA